MEGIYFVDYTLIYCRSRMSYTLSSQETPALLGSQIQAKSLETAMQTDYTVQSIAKRSALGCRGVGRTMNNRNCVLLKRLTWVLSTLLCISAVSIAEAGTNASSPRERLLFDSDWRFALGSANRPNNYLGKAGSATGATSAEFDDNSWRKVNLPHDWAVELPFNEKASCSHGFKAIGANFPDNSVGCYRKKFTVPASDHGKHITLEFDGVFRDSQVFVNGFYLGREDSGYSGFSYDITDYLNYGGSNTISVVVDATQEEGWFYEGAGIYRHVWMVKTAPLHVAKWGTYITSQVKDSGPAEIAAKVTVNNSSAKEASFTLEEFILDADGKQVADTVSKQVTCNPCDTIELASALNVAAPKLWSIESPCLYKLVTLVRQNDSIVDRYESTFGIRTIKWDADRGFFLNGKRVELRGTCNHQDHAGVGAALPDALNEWRIKQLKAMGSNSIRTSHNAPTPELLDICDRLGILVMDENREYGINQQQLSELEQLIRRDRNHPSVVIWSLGNEEFGIEGNEKGALITQTMQSRAHRLDPTRPCTAAVSGGWGKGTSLTLDVMGFNYFTHGNNVEYHKQFPNQPSVATEDASTLGTRGVYFEDKPHQHLTAYDRNKPDWGLLAEESWTHYAALPYVAGLYQWTGFDYRGEPTPFEWPAISTQFGILDTCGFPKDNFYYYQSWWSDHPVLHVFPHWNWEGKEGENIDVWVHSNCDEVELFLNGHSLGRKTMARNSHLQWQVKYEPGTLLARGYRANKLILTDKVETTGAATTVQMHLENASSTLQKNGTNLYIVTVEVRDNKWRSVPTASQEINFRLTGPGTIIGVGNGDPASQEADKCEGDPAGNNAIWKRSLFNGLAQIIVQSSGEPGELILYANSPGLAPQSLKLPAQ